MVKKFKPKQDISLLTNPRFEDEITATRIGYLRNWFDVKFEFLGEGRHRRVYRHKNWVLKLPINDQGIDSNDWEEYVSRKHKNAPDVNGIRYARCHFLNRYVLVMEYVEEPKRHHDKPKWADYVDCGQVGRDKNGVFKAYDYGL